MNKKIFVSGAAGFIGFHLSKALCQMGHEVLGYDNFNAYYDPKLKQDRAHQLREMGISILSGDLCDLPFLHRTLTDFRPSHVVNLAAQAGVRYSLQDPHAYIAANVVGFLNVLEYCRQAPETHLVYASSSSVYGLNEKIPFSETDRTDHQASLYGVTKKSNELMAQAYHHLYNVRSVGLRFFTVYGPWGRPDMAYYSFAQDMLAGKPIKIFNQGKMQRDFTYIDDIVQGVIQALSVEATANIYNLGNHRPEPLSALIEALETALGVQAQKEYLPMQAGDVESTFADIEQSRRDLGFIPNTPLEKGIGHFVEWFKAYHGHPQRELAFS